jgi:hypothetical protein
VQRSCVLRFATFRMADEQFHEFHLDGKQMVFLFMATTVVAVVIFLCGVMVGARCPCGSGGAGRPGCARGSGAGDRLGGVSRGRP